MARGSSITSGTGKPIYDAETDGVQRHDPAAEAPGPEPDPGKLFTPEQIRKLKSMGYL